ncbi:MAG: hypothetical protein SPL80_01855 [Bacilli bacterium]|nr:hypothetical protein [Bacilli bacterium]
MKKSILLGLGVCALALGGVAALVNNKSQTKVDAITNNASIYLDLSQEGYTWWANGVDDTNSDGEGKTVIGLYTWNDKTWEKVRGNRVKGFDNDYLFEFVFDAAKYSNMLFYRADGSLHGTYFNQTYDWNNFNDSSQNVWKITSNNEIEKRSGMENSWNLDYAGRANLYAEYVKELTASGCAAKTAPASADWNELKREFNAMNASSQALVLAADAAGEGGTKLEEAVTRYDLIVANYGVEDFISRKESGGDSGAKAIGTVGEERDSTIALISVVLLASVGASAFLIAKKHRRA